jgi:hypothetical protein
VVVWWCGGVVVWWCGGVVVWWCGGVVVWFGGRVVVWWCGGVVVWWRGGVVVWWCGVVVWCRGGVVLWWWCGRVVWCGRLNAGGSPVWPEDRRNRNGSSMPWSGLLALRCVQGNTANGKARLVSGDFYLTRPPPELLRPGGLGWWDRPAKPARPLLQEPLLEPLLEALPLTEEQPLLQEPLLERLPLAETPLQTPLPDLPLLGFWHEGCAQVPFIRTNIR